MWEVDIMPNTAAVYARIDPTLKKEAEAILSELNVSPSALIQMLYSQIKLTRGIPFDVKLPGKRPVFIDDLTKEQFDEELSKGYNEVKEGKTLSLEEAEYIIKKGF